jgi:branched-chain amino acid transport system substrate-binding protein
MMNRRWKIIFLCVMCVGLLVSLPAGVLAAAKGEIRIAVGGPHTGFAAEFGAEEFRGAELALQELGGKIAGRPVKLLKTDTKCDASEAVKKFRDSLLRDKVHAFIGPVCGSSGLAIVEWAKDYPDLPILIAYSAPEDVTMRKRQYNVLRPGWTGTQDNYYLGKYVVEEKGWKRVIMIGQDYSFPWGQTHGFIRGFCRSGGEKVYKIYHPPNTEDYSSYLLKIRSMAKDYDAMAMNTAGSDAVALFKQFFEFGLDKQINLFGFTNAFDSTALPTLGDKAIGMISAMHYVEGLEYAKKGMFPKDVIDRWLRFKKAYMAKYGHIPSCPAEQAYVALMLYARGVEAVGGDIENKKGELLDALHIVDMTDAPRGPFVLDEFGHATQNVYIREVQKHDGRLVNVPIKVYREVTQFTEYVKMKEDYMRQPPASRDYPPGDCSKLCPNGLGPYPDGKCPK